MRRTPSSPANYLEIIAANLAADRPGPDAAHLEVGANTCAIVSRDTGSACADDVVFPCGGAHEAHCGDGRGR